MMMEENNMVSKVICAVVGHTPHKTTIIHWKKHYKNVHGIALYMRDSNRFRRLYSEDQKLLLHNCTRCGEHYTVEENENV